MILNVKYFLKLFSKKKLEEQKFNQLACEFLSLLIPYTLNEEGGGFRHRFD